MQIAAPNLNDYMGIHILTSADEALAVALEERIWFLPHCLYFEAIGMFYCAYQNRNRARCIRPNCGLYTRVVVVGGGVLYSGVGVGE